MAYAFTMDVPIDRGTYDRILEGLGTTPPSGLVCHMCVEREDGGLRYIELWESKEDWVRFQEERLHPVVNPVLARVGFTERPPEPEVRRLTVHHHWGAYTSTVPA